MSRSPVRLPPAKRVRRKSRPVVPSPPPGERSRSPSSSSSSSSSKSSSTTTTPSPAEVWFRALEAESGAENEDAHQYVYLATVSHILPETLAATDLCDISGLTRQEVGEMFMDALNNPDAQSTGGRPRKDQGQRVEKIVVFKELHEDGSPHFHVCIKLCNHMRFVATKKTLRGRHKLPSHWS